MDKKAEGCAINSQKTASVLGLDGEGQCPASMLSAQNCRWFNWGLLGSLPLHSQPPRAEAAGPRPN